MGPDDRAEAHPVPRGLLDVESACRSAAGAATMERLRAAVRSCAAAARAQLERRRACGSSSIDTRGCIDSMASRYAIVRPSESAAQLQPDEFPPSAALSNYAPRRPPQPRSSRFHKRVKCGVPQAATSLTHFKKATRDGSREDSHSQRAGSCCGASDVGAPLVLWLNEHVSSWAETGPTCRA